MSNSYQALSVPPAANERGGVEVLRCAIIDGELHLTLRPAFNEPNGWGHVFAEVARQVARVYAHENRFTEDRLARAHPVGFRRPNENCARCHELDRSARLTVSGRRELHSALFEMDAPTVTGTHRA